MREDTLDSQFARGLFIKDTTGYMNERSPLGDNQGLRQRAQYTSQSWFVELIVPVYADLFLKNGMDLKIKLIRAKDEFCLMVLGNLNYIVVNIVSAIIYVKKVSIAPGINLAHAKALTHATVKYPIDHVCLINFSISAGNKICNQDNLFLG